LGEEDVLELQFDHFRSFIGGSAYIFRSKTTEQLEVEHQSRFIRRIQECIHNVAPELSLAEKHQYAEELGGILAQQLKAELLHKLTN
jgi:hypothetical protein